MRRSLWHHETCIFCRRRADRCADATPAGAAHGIGIIIDIHATNGSQNGFDHSAPVAKGQQLWDSAAQPTPSYPAQVAGLKLWKADFGQVP